MPTLIAHPTGNYRFLPGIAPYSCGVVADPGFEVVHVALQQPRDWFDGFEFVERFLQRQARPRAALCAMELRSPSPFTMQGFIEFNRQYCAVLESWGVFVEGQNPIARTNVAPVGWNSTAPQLVGFSFMRPNPELARPSWIVAGAGELIEGTLVDEGILRRGETSPDAILEKARYVVQVMCERLAGLGGSWSEVSRVSAYTIHSLDRVLAGLLLAEMPAVARSGVRWLYSRPPVIDIEFEMDLQGVVTEWLV